MFDYFRMVLNGNHKGSWSADRMRRNDPEKVEIRHAVRFPVDCIHDFVREPITGIGPRHPSRSK
jgi:hypothetical protein